MTMATREASDTASVTHPGPASGAVATASPGARGATSASTRALVLFAHGARDARWREPFDRLHGKLAALLPHCAVRLAFLELMAPSLPEALAELAAAGAADITVVPVFFGQGGHLRRDLPALIDQCRDTWPALRLRCATAVGEDDSVLDAIAAYCAGTLAG